MASRVPGGFEPTRARLFPLTLLSTLWKPPTRSARNRRRLTVYHSITSVANRCIVTLNRMYDSTSPLTRPPPPVTHPRSPPHRHQPGIHSPSTTGLTRSPTFIGSLSQCRFLAHIYNRCCAFVLTVRGRPFTGAARDIGAMPHDLLKSWDFVSKDTPDIVGFEGPLPDAQLAVPALPLTSSFSSSPTAVTPLVARRVALPDALHIVPLVDVLPPDIVATYSVASSSNLLRSPLAVFELNVASPLRAARIAGSRAEYVKLVARLIQQRMVSFTDRPLAVNGVFAVNKDDANDRLIIDAQPANRLFVDSPHVSLPDPSTLVQLQVPVGHTMFVGKSDLSNFYHHLGLPEWMKPYFALPPLTSSEMASIGLDPADSGRFPMCNTLPMGFSHAVFLANSAHEHVIYSSNAVSPDDNILRMSSPNVTVDSALHDDFFIFSLDQQLATRQFENVIAAYRRAGFIIKDSKVVLPTSDTVKVIGFDVSGRSSLLTLNPDSQLSLVQATLTVLTSGFATGTTMSHIIGCWTWNLLLRRSSLSILQHVYRFIGVAGRRRFQVWPTVRRELWMLIGILPLLTSDLSSPMFHRVIASDASEIAGGVVSTVLTPSLHQRMWPLCSTRHHAVTQAQLNAADRQNRECHPDLTSNNVDPLSDIAAMTILHRAYLAHYSSVVTTRWSTVLSVGWRNPEHINALELRAVLLSVHWMLSFPSSISRRVYILVDSTVAFFSVWKGRSSAPSLLLILRKIGALLLGSGTSLMPGWIPSIVNPADGPSRLREIGTAGNSTSHSDHVGG